VYACGGVWTLIAMSDICSSTVDMRVQLTRVSVNVV